MGQRRLGIVQQGNTNLATDRPARLVAHRFNQSCRRIALRQSSNHGWFCESRVRERCLHDPWLRIKKKLGCDPSGAALCEREPLTRGDRLQPVDQSFVRYDFHIRWNRGG